MFLVIIFGAPFLAFCAAGAIELRNKESQPKKFRALLPIAFGILASGLLLADMLFDLALRFETPRESLIISGIMTLLCIGIATAAAFTRFSSKRIKVLAVLAALLAAFFWFVNRVVA